MTVSRNASWFAAATVGAALGIWAARTPVPAYRDIAGPIATATVVPSPAPPIMESVTHTPSTDVLDAYAAMRDDVNPKPRLRLIDDWARRARPDEARELLARAMVDPDVSVRERAQVLFDRSMLDR